MSSSALPPEISDPCASRVHSGPVSAAPAKWFVPATCIVAKGSKEDITLVYGEDTILAVQIWHLKFRHTERLVWLASPEVSELKYYTAAWCYYPYGVNLLECSRILPGRNRDAAWRQAQLDSVADDPDPSGRLKREGVNATDTSSARSTALFGSPVRRYPDDIANRLATKVVRLDAMDDHGALHPDVVAPGSAAARQAAELRWAVLPMLLPKETRHSPESCEQYPELLHETPDFTRAKDLVRAAPAATQFLADAELGTMRFGPRHVLLPEAVKGRVDVFLEFAIERALCGPHDGRKLRGSRTVSAFALRIARNELYNQCRRQGTGYSRRAAVPAGSDSASVTPIAESLDGETQTLFDDWLGEFQDVPEPVLREAAGAVLEHDASDADLFQACVALAALSEKGAAMPKKAEYLGALVALAKDSRRTRVVRDAAERALEILGGRSPG